MTTKLEMIQWKQYPRYAPEAKKAAPYIPNWKADQYPTASDTHKLELDMNPTVKHWTDEVKALEEAIASIQEDGRQAVAADDLVTVRTCHKVLFELEHELYATRILLTTLQASTIH